MCLGQGEGQQKADVKEESLSNAGQKQEKTRPDRKSRERSVCIR